MRGRYAWPENPPKELLERIHSLQKEQGKMAAIDPDTGEWFLGETLLEAVAKARQKYPDKVFHIVRVGSPVAYQMKGSGQQQCEF